MLFRTNTNRLNDKTDNIALHEISRSGGIKPLHPVDGSVPAFVERMSKEIAREFSRTDLVKIGLSQLTFNELPNTLIISFIGIDLIFLFMAITIANLTGLVISLIADLAAMILQTGFLIWEITTVAKPVAVARITEIIYKKLYGRD